MAYLCLSSVYLVSIRGSAPDCRLLLHASIAPADFVRLILVNPESYLDTLDTSGNASSPTSSSSCGSANQQLVSPSDDAAVRTCPCSALVRWLCGGGTTSGDGRRRQDSGPSTMKWKSCLDIRVGATAVALALFNPPDNNLLPITPFCTHTGTPATVNHTPFAILVLVYVPPL